MLSICEQFQLKAQAVSCAPYGNGHINATYLVKTAGGPDYILQRISRQAFHDVPALMRNVALVTAYLAQRDPDPRHTLHLVPALDGRSYWQAQDGEYYRVYDFITDSVSLDRPERPGDLYAYLRQSEDQLLLCVVNTGVHTARGWLPLPDGMAGMASIQDLYSGRSLAVEHGGIPVVLQPGEGMILE